MCSQNLSYSSRNASQTSDETGWKDSINKINFIFDRKEYAKRRMIIIKIFWNLIGWSEFLIIFFLQPRVNPNTRRLVRFDIFIEIILRWSRFFTGFLQTQEEALCKRQMAWRSIANFGGNSCIYPSPIFELLSFNYFLFTAEQPLVNMNNQRYFQKYMFLR